MKEAFQWTKDQLLGKSVLRQPDLKLQFVIHTDASAYGCGAVLSQWDEKDNKLHPCRYLSHKFSDAERNWSTFEREAYAIVYTLQHLEYYVRASPLKVIIWTDHSPLRFLHRTEKGRLVRWWVGVIQPHMDKIEILKIYNTHKPLSFHSLLLRLSMYILTRNVYHLRT